MKGNGQIKRFYWIKVENTCIKCFQGRQQKCVNIIIFWKLEESFYLYEKEIYCFKYRNELFQFQGHN